MKVIFKVILLGVCGLGEVAAQQDSSMMERIYTASFEKGKAYENLRYLTKDIAHRIAGSAKVEEAVTWSKSLIEEFDIHHTAKDVFEAVDRRELQSGVAAIASLLYLVDQQIDRLP